MRLKLADKVLYDTIDEEKKTRKKIGDAQKDEWSRHLITNDVS